jgi:predicted secreted hydrolase
MKTLARPLAALGSLALLIGGFWYVTRTSGPPTRPPLTGPTPDTSGFARASAPREFVFPADHGPHPDYQTEWWYYTGNLTAEDGRRFGYQLTFFRRGLSPGAPPSEAGLATNQIYFAHFALTDVAGERHRAVERFSRGAAGLAGAEGEPYRAWLEGWTVEALNADGSEVRLSARDGELGVDLRLRAVKPIVAHGDRGLSAKSDQAGNASYYLSYTRMATDGRVTAGGQSVAVTGESWFDHEWSTRALGPDAVGWDWFSLQLSDGRDLMLYLLRRADGGLEAVSGGTLVAADGRATAIGVDEVSVRPLGQWTSPATGVTYPSGWALSAPAAQLELTLEPWLEAQEMQLFFSYWEGAVRVSGTSLGAPVTGNGYVELTGYAASMQSVLGGGP